MKNIQLEEEVKCDSMTNFRKAGQDDLPVLKKLWYEAFLEHDSQESIDYYFEANFDLDFTFVLEVNNEIVSSLQLNQHQIVYNDKVINVSFVIGVATFISKRGQGYMKQLLNKAIAYARDELKQNFIILQAYNWDLYRPFGFIDAYYKSVNLFNLDDLDEYEASKLSDIDEQLLLAIYNDYTKDLNGYCLRNVDYFSGVIKMFIVENVKVVCNKDAYLFYQVSNERIIINECAFRNKESLYSLLKSCLVKENLSKATLYSDIINFEEEKELFMMVKNLNEEQFLINDKLYISETI